MKIEEKETKVRLDKWLWAARFFKTRELAIKAIKQGKVLYEGQKVNPGREVRIGATLIVSQGNVKKTIIIQALQTQRQSAPIAQALYEETKESVQLREETLMRNKERKWLNMSAPKPDKRPEKGARRKMRQLRRQQEQDP